MLLRKISLQISAVIDTTDIYSRRGKNWPVAIKKAYKVKEKTV
jgi:hypothetical protein